jgi:hypothetical protein
MEFTNRLETTAVCAGCVVLFGIINPWNRHLGALYGSLIALVVSKLKLVPPRLWGIGVSATPRSCPGQKQQRHKTEQKSVFFGFN